MDRPLPTEPSRPKARSFQDILHEFGPITDVYFEPFQVEPKRAARALLPPTFPS